MSGSRGNDGRDEPPVELTGAFAQLERDFREMGAKKQQQRGGQIRKDQFQGRRAGRRGEVGRRLVGPVVGGLAAFLAVGGVAAVGTGVFSSDDGTRGSDAGAPTDTRHAPGDAFRGLAVAADPVVAHRKWGVGVFPGAKPSETCILAGTIKDGRLGRDQDGKFAAFSKTYPGRCDDVRRTHIVFRTRSYAEATGSRTLLFGVADRSVTELKIGTPGRERALPVADDGTFILVGAGADALHGQVLVIRRGSATTNIPLQPAFRPPKPR